MAQLSKQYNPKQHEEKIYQDWESSGAFKPDQAALDAGKEPYTIMLPPPNITGSLHLGHALQDTIMDILARYHRMLGCPVLWQPGTDHAALPTNKILKEKLAEEGKTPEDLGRDGYADYAQAWYDKTSAEILNQMKRIGATCDWSRSRFTMDEDYVEAVTKAFIDYYNKGYIYRGARIVNWDPATQTTVSDLEIDYKTEPANFYYFQYGPFEIGTARPETKFADKYIVVHPDDERYSQYEHKQEFEVEWINGPIKATLIKDEAADPEMGSGAMTITPWHSDVDFELAQKHDLDMEQIIDFDGNLLPVAREFAGMPISTAREKIVEKLKSKNLLIRIDENYEHNLALNDRGKGVIEPQVMRQWFVDMSKLKDETIKVVDEDKIKFIPDRWRKHFLSWMHEVRDWNINRQIWLGHRLPVWWKAGKHNSDDEDGNFIVALESPGEDYEQDPDSLDTWFSSALWPFATLNQPGDLEKFYPTSVLVTARDILYLWVARMIFSGIEFAGDIPFKDVFIHPTVLTKEGKRMSKSLGTGIDPLDLIDEYGADALRFGLMSQMNYDNQAIRFDETDVELGRNFTNKIWNIARLLENLDIPDEPTIADTWIEQRWKETHRSVTEKINEYKIGEAINDIYKFIWQDYADWYLEILKTGGSIKTARDVFQKTLITLHPFMPYLTEALWEGDGMLIKARWNTSISPTVKSIKPSDHSEETDAMSVTAVRAKQDMQDFQDLVTGARSYKKLLNIPAGEKVQLYSEKIPVSAASLARLTQSEILENPLPNMVKLPNNSMLSSSSITSESIQKTLAKLKREIANKKQFIASQEKTIQSMSGKAPESAIQQKQATLESAQSELEKLSTSHQAILDIQDKK